LFAVAAGVVAAGVVAAVVVAAVVVVAVVCVFAQSIQQSYFLLLCKGVANPFNSLNLN